MYSPLIPPPAVVQINEPSLSTNSSSEDSEGPISLIELAPPTESQSTPCLILNNNEERQSTRLKYIELLIFHLILSFI